MVNTMNFGGDDHEDMDNRKKSRKEIFEEIIEKSKAYKDANKELKTINTELIKELDDDYIDIVSKLDFTRKKAVPQESKDPKIKTADEKGKEFDSVQYSLKMNLVKAQAVTQTLTEHDKAAQKKKKLVEAI